MGGCHFRLDDRETRELCGIIDQYAQAYIHTLRELERVNDLEEYCLAPGGVRLLKVSQSVLACMERYARTEPKLPGGDQILWGDHGFRLETERGRGRFAIMWEPVELTFWYSQPQFWLVLRLSYGEEDGIMEREAMWSPTTVCKWLQTQWIPLALRYCAQKDAGSRLRFWGRAKAERFVEQTMEQLVWDTRAGQKAVFHRQICDVSALLTAVDALQLHFSLPGTQAYHCAGRPLRLCEALAVLLESARLNDGTYQYIAGKLGSAAEREAVRRALTDRIAQQAEQRLYFSGEIDQMLRCMSVCIRESRNDIGFQTVRRVAAYLSDLVERYNRDILIEKYAGQSFP